MSALRDASAVRLQAATRVWTTRRKAKIRQHGALSSLLRQVRIVRMSELPLALASTQGQQQSTVRMEVTSAEELSEMRWWERTRPRA